MGEDLTAMVTRAMKMLKKQPSRSPGAAAGKPQETGGGGVLL